MVEGKKVFLRDVDSFHTPGTTSKLAPSEKKPAVNAGRRMGSILALILVEHWPFMELRFAWLALIYRSL